MDTTSITESALVLEHIHVRVMCAPITLRCEAGPSDELTEYGGVTELAVRNNRAQCGDTRPVIIRTVVY